MRNIAESEVRRWEPDVPVKAGYNKDNGWFVGEGAD